MELLNYLLKVSACTALFFCFYLLVLRKLTFFKINRFYLLSTLFLSFIIPALQFEVEKNIDAVFTEIKSAPINQISQAKDVNSSPEYISLSNAQHFDWFTFAESMYLVIACSFFAFSIWQLFKIISQTKNVSKNVGGLKIIYKRTGFSNCSFFNYVFIDHETITEAELNVILKHEQVHANQLHSVDKIVMMVFKALLWFNPIIYLYNKALEETHEFEADEITSLRFGNGTYANLLLKLATDKSDSPLVHNFVKSPINRKNQNVI